MTAISNWSVHQAEVLYFSSGVGFSFLVMDVYPNKPKTPNIKAFSVVECWASEFSMILYEALLEKLMSDAKYSSQNLPLSYSISNDNA